MKNVNLYKKLRISFNDHRCRIKVFVFIFSILLLTYLLFTGSEIKDPYPSSSIQSTSKINTSSCDTTQHYAHMHGRMLRFLTSVRVASGEWVGCESPLLSLKLNASNINMNPYTSEFIRSSKAEEPLRKRVEALLEVPPVNVKGLPDIQLQPDVSWNGDNFTNVRNYSSNSNNPNISRVFFADLMGINGDGSALPVDNERNKSIFFPYDRKTIEGLTAVEQAKLADDILFKRIIKSNWQAKTVSDINFGKIPPVYLWQKSEKDISLKWALLEAGVELHDIIKGDKSKNSLSKRLTSKSNRIDRSVVTVACIYAGFLRDYKNMFRPCYSRKCDKGVGSQETNIVDSSKCDVYFSTWDIPGKGRYSVSTYDMAKRINISAVKELYGNRLAALHVQSYGSYERIWKFMARYPRLFPQTRPVKSYKSSWWGTSVSNYFFRVNDYSQSYKHWCVVQLALLSGFKYDLFFRLRPDIRSVGRISNFRFALEYSNKNEGKEDCVLEMNKGCIGIDKREDKSHRRKGKAAISFDVTRFYQTKGSPTHTSYITANRLHSQIFNYADFGFIGTPKMIQSLTAPWFYCLMPPRDTVLSNGSMDTVRSSQRSMYPPIRTLSQEFSFIPDTISEYNLVLWRIIFDSQWEVDNGKMYLRVDRRFK